MAQALLDLLKSSGKEKVLMQTAQQAEAEDQSQLDLNFFLIDEDNLEKKYKKKSGYR